MAIHKKGNHKFQKFIDKHRRTGWGGGGREVAQPPKKILRPAIELEIEVSFGQNINCIKVVENMNFKL